MKLKHKFMIKDSLKKAVPEIKEKINDKRNEIFADTFLAGKVSREELNAIELITLYKKLIDRFLNNELSLFDFKIEYQKLNKKNSDFNYIQK